jgi:hypothetical protein
MKTLHRGQLIGIGLLVFFVVFMVMPLNKASAFPSPVIEDVGVVSCNSFYSTGSIVTIFYSYISGPSPEDVASFTVTGPSGVFNLTPVISSRQRGLIYIHVENSVVANGSYTFEVTDSLLHKVSVVKNFIYNSTLPQVDVLSMSPQNEDYVDTTTPTLSFDPVPGNVYYKIYLSDYNGQATWYMSSITKDTSFSVPEGLLQPNTPYTWYVRVFDSDTDPQNCHQSESLAFYTGTKAFPNLDTRYATSFELPDFGGNWFGVANTNVAPWDITDLKVTSPDSTVYSLDNILFRFCMPAYYCIMSNSPFPMPGGIYTFEIEDDETNHATETLNYHYDPLPFIAEDSMTPDNNAYFDTNTLNFSWNPLEGTGGPYYYRVRIWDYNEKVIWYDSSPSTETSVPIPVSGNFIRGSSYKWQLVVYDSVPQANNYTFSTPLRSFTINMESVPNPNIKANDSDGPITITTSDTLSVTIELDPGNYPGVQADWWVLANTSFGLYYKNPFSGWQPGLSVTHQGPLFNLTPPLEVLNTSGLPEGNYTFYFGVDGNMNGNLDGPLFYDSVEVNITSP